MHKQDSRATHTNPFLVFITGKPEGNVDKLLPSRTKFIAQILEMANISQQAIATTVNMKEKENIYLPSENAYSWPIQTNPAKITIPRKILQSLNGKYPKKCMF